MTVLSVLRAFRPNVSIKVLSAKSLIAPTTREVTTTSLLSSEGAMTWAKARYGDKMMIRPSHDQWHHFKDHFHFYVLLGAIPLTAIIFFVNVFIGPAKLVETPEGYEPKHWEYYRHPITRWLVRYFFYPAQEVYEKNLFYLWEMYEYRDMDLLERRCKKLMQARGDMLNIYLHKVIGGKFLRSYIKTVEKQQDLVGVRSD